MSVKRQKGFTLVELVATLIIIGLIAAVSGPLFFDVGVFQKRGFFEETLAAVRYAQKHAVATNCNVRVNITATGFTLFRPANAGACNTGTYNTDVVDPSSGAPTFTRTAPDGMTITTSASDIIFSGDGRASTGATVTVGVGAPSFTVIAGTGFVQRQ
jgi:MSHA pilin protein MshC